MTDFYDDVEFPRSISLTAFKGKVSRSTRRFTVQSGVESRIALQASSLRSYDAGLVPRTATEWQLIADLFEVAFGPVFGFLLHDETDYKVGPNRGAFVATGNPLEYAFQKRYLVGTRAVYRGIAKPKVFPVPILTSRLSGGTPVVIDPATYTIDYTNGRVLHSADSAALAGDLGWLGEHWVPVHFDTDDLDWNSASKSVDELYLEAPSVPIRELRWRGMPLRAPDMYVGTSATITIPPPAPPPLTAATALTLTPAAASGLVYNVVQFTVTANGPLAAAVNVTIASSDGSDFITIPSVTLTDASRSAVLALVPTVAGTKSITISNDGALSDPAPATLTVAPGVATSIVLVDGPTAGTAGHASRSFRFGVDGTLAAPVTVTPVDSSNDGTWSPASVTITSATDVQTSVYTPGSVGYRALAVTNNGGLSNGYSYSFTVVAYPPILQASPGSLSSSPNAPSPAITVGTNAPFDVATVVTPHSSVSGGSFSPVSATIGPGHPDSVTFTRTAVAIGTETITFTNDQGLTNPDPVTVKVANYPTTLTLTPSSMDVVVNTASDLFTATLDKPAVDSLYVSLSSSGYGGSFSGDVIPGSYGSYSLGFEPGATTKTFRRIAANVGVETISLTVYSGPTTGAPATITVTAS